MAWTEAKAKEKAKISRVNTEDMESTRAEAEASMREKTNAVQRAAAEAAANIRANAEA